MTNVVHNNTISEPNQSQDGHSLGNISSIQDNYVK